MKLNLHNITKCKACGAENVKGLVACSLFGSYSGAWCENCLKIHDINKFIEHNMPEVSGYTICVD